MPALSTPETFWKRVTDRPNGCREWTGSLHRDGYGQLMYHRKSWLAHRLAWVLTFGPIDRDACVCHTCDNPRCCNPDHLFVGDHAANMDDMRRKGRRLAVNSGADNGRAKLTDIQVASIRAAYASGSARQVDLAQAFNVSQSLISLIVRSEAWRPS